MSSVKISPVLGDASKKQTEVVTIVTTSNTSYVWLFLIGLVIAVIIWKG